MDVEHTWLRGADDPQWREQAVRFMYAFWWDLASSNIVSQILVNQIELTFHRTRQFPNADYVRQAEAKLREIADAEARIQAEKDKNPGEGCCGLLALIFCGAIAVMLLVFGLTEMQDDTSGKAETIPWVIGFFALLALMGLWMLVRHGARVDRGEKQLKEIAVLREQVMRSVAPYLRKV